jgi:N-acetylglucosamine repressor
LACWYLRNGSTEQGTLPPARLMGWSLDVKHVNTKKEMDKQVVEAVVRKFGPVSRVQIHELTHLRRTVISELVRELLNEGRLVEGGRVNNPMGRKQILLRISEDRGVIVGVEFDEEFVVAACMNLRPRVIAKTKEPVDLRSGLEGLVRQLTDCVRKVAPQSGLDKKPLVGIGIADPGLVNSRDGVTVTSSTIDFWKQVPLREIFENEFEVPTLVESKTRAKAVAERFLGAGEMAENMVYIDYGTGIGAGVIVEGRLLLGQTWAAGEFGHTHIVENGPACKCGSFGCLEALVGLEALATRIRRAVQEGSYSLVLELAGNDPARITGWTVLEAARMGDKTSSAIVEQAGNCLGLGLANLINLFNPAVVVLDQRLEVAGQGLLEHMVRIIRIQALRESTEDLSVRFGRMGNDAGVIGVGLMVVERHFEIPTLKAPRFMIESIPSPVERPTDLTEPVPHLPRG